MRLLPTVTAVTAMALTACGSQGGDSVCDTAAGDAGERSGLVAPLSSAVAIYSEGPKGVWGFCSGVLVGPKTVLTAAHCVHAHLEWRYEAYFVEDLAFEKSTARPNMVAGVVIHPDYDPDGQGEFDLALMELETEAPTTPLPWTADMPSEVGVNYSFVGYGGDDDEMTQCLRVSNEVTGIELEASPVRLRGFIHPDIYFGDSGGPLLVDTGSGPAVIGVLAQSWFVGSEVTQGSLAYFAKLRDDSWSRMSMPTDPVVFPAQ